MKPFLKASFVVVLVVLLLALSLFTEPTLAADAPLFIPAAPPASISRDQPCRASIPRASGDARSSVHYVTVNAERLATLQEAEMLSLNPLDQDYIALRKEVLPRPSGDTGYIWTGTLADVPASSVELVVGSDALYGRIGLPGAYLTVYRIEGELYAVEQHELDAAPVSLAEISLVDVASDASTLLPLPLPDADQRLEDGSEINVMVVYTPAAQSILERVAGSVSLAVDGAIAHTNTIFEASGIYIRLKLVHVQPVFYLEQPNEDFSADLNNLMGKADGYMDEIHPLRDEYAADLVAMISGVWFASYTGIAPSPSPLDERKGFSITEACNIQDTTFTEQIGLNLGSARDFYNTNNASNTGGFPVLAYGHGYQAPDASFVTVMALRTGGVCPPIVTANICGKLERFSSPHQTYNGQPLGNETTANNVRSINELAATVANYRTTNPDVTAQLVVNGGFEIDADADRTPDFWKISSKGKTDCIDAGHNSLCALKLSRSGSRATQKLIGSEAIAPDTPILLAAWVRSKQLLSEADVRLILHYADDTKSVIKVAIPPGTTIYQLLSASGMAEQAVNKLKLVARLNAAETGKLWLDDISVTVYDSDNSDSGNIGQ